MTDRITDLERLQQLRTDGVIDEDEFAREKARLLADDTVAIDPPARSRRWIGLVVGAGAVVAVGALGYALVYAPQEQPVVSNGTAPVTATPPADPLAGLMPAERVKLAETAAFPDGLFYTTDEGSRIEYETGTLVETPFGPVLVNEGKVPDAAHVDSGHVAVHYLAPSGKGYRVTKAFPDAIQSGSFGQMSEFAVSDKFATLPVIYTEGGGTWQGYTCGFTQLTELRPGGPVELVSFQDSYSNGGASADGKDEQSIEGKIGEIVPDKSFMVNFTGDRVFTARYVRAGEKYQLEGGEKNALSGC